MKIALIQIDLVWERPAENHRLAERWIREAAALGARVAILPEMFTCGFSIRHFPEPDDALLSGGGQQ